MSEHESERVEALLRLFERFELEELVLEEPDFKIHLRRRAPGRAAAAGAPAPAAPAPVPVEPAHPQPATELKVRTVAVRAPLIGIFYATPSPESPPFVKVGDLVREGQTVCIVEAMKVFNEIKSDWAGRVVEIPAQSGKLVQAGDPLVVLELLD